LTAAPVSEYSNHVISVGNEKILPIAAIFGANASGKSNVHEAFRYMSTYVVSSFGFGDDSGKRSKSNFSRPTPFILDARSKDAESTFEIYFITSEENGSKSYNYGFTVDKNGINEEWLNYRSKTSRGDYKRIFYRKGAELDLPGIISKSQENIRIALEKEALIVSLGAKLKISKLKLIRDWFLNNEFADFGCPIENFFYLNNCRKILLIVRKCRIRLLVISHPLIHLSLDLRLRLYLMIPIKNPLKFESMPYIK